MAPFANAQSLAESPRLRLDISQLNPRIVTPATPTLSIAGSVTNVGDRRISTLQVRLELGTKLSTEKQARSTMSGTVSSPDSMSRFTDIQPAVLEPGQTGQFNVTVKLDGSSNNLRVSGPGVFPLLVNVNGTPDYGGPARLATLSMLLPVLGAPGKTPAPAPGQPAGVTVLWPIADTRPRIVAAPYGQKAVLSDDVLAGELRPGGRLDALVSAAEEAQSNPQLAHSLCYAVDPDLLDTVDAMSQGYDVRTPTGNVPGGGTEVAKTWVTTLRRLVAHQCVIQLPYADADLPALAKVRGGDLMSYAL